MLYRYCFCARLTLAVLFAPMSTRYAILTGGNAGLGLLTAQALVTYGFHLTITVRSADKGEAAVKAIRDAVPEAVIDYGLMDLTDLSSVRAFADWYRAKGHALHLLVNNAGIMATPFQKTVDGIESQFQVNHISHFLVSTVPF